MAITLENPARRIVLFGVLGLAALQLVLSTRSFLAAYFGEKLDLSHLRLATRLDPGNAEYQYRLGKFFSDAIEDPTSALRYYQSAGDLNPYNARYWLGLAATDQILGDTIGQKVALERAVHANPTDPNVAWEAGNFYLVQGDTERAFPQFKIVIESQPNMAGQALQLCWRVSPDADVLLSQVLPPTTSAYLSALELLIGKKDISGAGKVWRRLIDLRQPFPTQRLFDYVKFLLSQHQVDEARTAWQQSAALLGLNAYLPSSNLMINGQFTEEVLNGGFDWNYQTLHGVTLTLDPTQFHSAHRSLLVAFDGSGISDAGVFQVVPVEPNKGYTFSAYFKSGEFQGAGGPVLTVRDFYSGKSYFASEELKNSEVWKPIEGSFTTGPDTPLLIVRIERVPPGLAIRGRLWVDDFDLTPN